MLEDQPNQPTISSSGLTAAAITPMVGFEWIKSPGDAAITPVVGFEWIKSPRDAMIGTFGEEATTTADLTERIITEWPSIAITTRSRKRDIEWENRRPCLRPWLA